MVTIGLGIEDTSGPVDEIVGIAVATSVDLIKWNLIEWRGGTVLSEKPLKYLYLEVTPFVAKKAWERAKKIKFSKKKNNRTRPKKHMSRQKLNRIRNQYPIHEQINNAWIAKELKKAGKR